MDRKIDR
jgi:hypothetical protein